jgi:hypothetical protein
MGMAETSYPYDAGAGIAVDEALWRLMVSRFMASGVIGATTRDAADTSLLPTLGSGGAGGIFQLAAGEAWVAGHKYNNSSTLTKTANANVNSNPRIDRLALKLDMTANTCVAVIVEGTPAASPTAPSLPDTSTVIHLPIARATCPGSASAQNYASLVQERLFVAARRYVGPSTGAAQAGVGGIQNGDEWLFSDAANDRILRHNGVWVGTRQRLFTGVQTFAPGTAPYTAPAGSIATFAQITIPAQVYAYQIQFAAHLQMGGLGAGNYIVGSVREDNVSSGTIRSEGTAVGVSVVDAPLSLPLSKPVTVAAGVTKNWWFNIVPNVGTGFFSWDSPANWFTATMTPLW